MFCTRARLCARADDAKIVRSRDLGNHLKEMQNSFSDLRVPSWIFLRNALSE